MAQHAQTERVHQWVALVGCVKADFARDRRDAEAVAVMSNAAHHAAEETAHLRGLQFAKAQRVHGADRPRAHGENIADDTAHTGRGSLEGFHRAGVIVRLHLESDGQIVSDVNDAGVFFSGADHDPVRAGRKGLQQRLGILIGAVFAPHHRENAQFRIGGNTTQYFQDIFVFFRCDSVFGHQFRGNNRFVHTCNLSLFN